MINKINKVIGENTFFHTIFLSLITILTFSPVLKMFFYSDDFGDLYDLTHNSFRYSHPPLISEYRLAFIDFLFSKFGLLPTGYYAVGIFVITISVIVLYFFASTLFKNKKMGLFTGLIYATCPIGISTVFMITTFYTESGYVINLMLLTILFLFVKYFQSRNLIYFISTAFLLNIFVSMQPKRGFLFLPILALFDYIMNAKKFIPSIGTVLRQVIFLIIFIYSYSGLPSLEDIMTGQLTSSHPIDMGAKLTALGHSFFEVSPFVTIANIFLAAPLIFIKEFSQDSAELDLRNLQTSADFIQLLIVLVTLISILTLIILTWKAGRKWGLLSLFSLGWIYSGILGFYVFSSPGVYVATSRTITLTAPAYALFMTISGFSLYRLIKDRTNISKKIFNNLFAAVAIVFIVTNFLATYYYLDNFNNNRSKYAHTFFRDLKTLYPQFPPNSLVYIETTHPHMRSRLYNIFKGNSYGSGGTLGIFYNLSYKELDLVTDHEDVEKFVGEDPTKIDRVFSFYYDQGELSDITSRVRSNLQREVNTL